MFRIRLHGRGGHGIKTAGRILGSAFFIEGWEVQDAPKYGAERRGAPMVSTVRAAREPIHERGIVMHPDLVVVVDDTLVAVPTAGVLQGLDASTTLLLYSHDAEDEWRERLKTSARLLILPAVSETLDMPFVAAACAGAAARLVGVVGRAALEEAVRHEVSVWGEAVVAPNVKYALDAFDALQEQAGTVTERVSAQVPNRPEWVDLQREGTDTAAPAIHGGVTSVQVRTGLWRTMRPIVDHDRCHQCAWICSSSCPDGVIAIDGESHPRIDLDHCKGCMICVGQCPWHVIRAVPERDARADDPPAKEAR